MRKNKGITIIALIITIIILLILVGVSINLAIKGDLFGSAEKAVNGTNAKVEEEQTRVDELMGELDEIEKELLFSMREKVFSGNYSLISADDDEKEIEEDGAIALLRKQTQK